MSDASDVLASGDGTLSHVNEFGCEQDMDAFLDAILPGEDFDAKAVPQQVSRWVVVCVCYDRLGYMCVVLLGLGLIWCHCWDW
ncbi:hypothetical protein KIPB_005945 [Kipferlia bialata]|uniref:Uncharacterized protein n=1 Tax=Kipferlia bialata TaxID=797122 RepID=A0A391NLT5_9EUKA|nr:hypothetical protein KIPB_005945 [Kipferlia bialata]|eukprot:g5945.t1